MVFSSLFFLYAFLPVSLLLYFLVPGIRQKNVVLLVSSLLFYAWGEPVYVLLMLISIAANYFFGRLMEKDPEKKKRTLVFAVVYNLFILGFFKYASFLLSAFNELFGTSFVMKALPLPIGISFYTFQTLSYLIDLYRGKFRAEKNLLNFGLYVTMYFQLIAGPIVRYEDVRAALLDREISLRRLGRGMARFFVGLGKKVLIANALGALFQAVQTGSGLTTAAAWLGAVAFMLQIYFDFSGYSDMAIGLGSAFGFDFPENFNRPYLSSSITEFWRRWHISLGSWFREYVYIPLGGSRVKPFRHVLNILIVWFLTGLWHGAAWNFALWGLYFGLLLLVEKFLFRKPLPKIPGVLATLFFVLIGWVLFSSPDLAHVWSTLQAMFGFAPGGLFDRTALSLILHYAAPLLAGLLLCLPFAGKFRDWMLTKSPFVTTIFTIIVLVLSTAFLVADSYNPFLYFRF